MSLALHYDYNPSTWEKLRRFVGFKVGRELSYDGYKKIADCIMQLCFGHTDWERFEYIIMERPLKTVTQEIVIRISYNDYQDTYLEVTQSTQ